MMKRFLTCTIAFLLILSSFTACANKIGDDPKDTQASAGVGREPAQSADSQETEPADRTVRLTFSAVGDNLIHESIFVEAKQLAAALASSDSYTRSYYFDSMYTDEFREIISSADISFVNQESPITGGAAAGYPNFNSPTEAGDALCDMGFDVVNIANNHMCDMEYSTTGLQKTIDYWKTKNILQIGGYENQSDYETIRYIEKDGVKIAMLSFTYGTNGYGVNSASSCVIPWIDEDVITSRIDAAEENADLVFVSMHWGAENTQTPTADQKRLAQVIADAGADAVIGHHSHTVQPIEWVTGAGGNRTLVIYSMGNLISTMLKPVNMVGIIASFDIVKEENMPAYIENVRAIPTVTHYVADTAVLDSQDLPTRSGVKVYLMENYSSALASAHGVQTQTSFDFETLKSYITGVIDEEFLK